MAKGTAILLLHKHLNFEATIQRGSPFRESVLICTPLLVSDCCCVYAGVCCSPTMSRDHPGTCGFLVLLYLGTTHLLKCEKRPKTTTEKFCKEALQPPFHTRANNGREICLPETTEGVYAKIKNWNQALCFDCNQPQAGKLKSYVVPSVNNQITSDSKES